MRIHILPLLCLAAWQGLACGTPTDLLGSPDTEPPASRKDSLLGATVTCDFPEVGIIDNGRPGCTATLVAPDMILTAAHCFDYATDEDGSTSYVFRLNAYAVTCSAPERIYPIKRFRSFVASDATNYNTGYKNDVAIAQLVQPVPSQLASPMNFHPGSIPAPGTTATAIGHGARDSIPCSAPSTDWKKGYTPIPIDSYVFENLRDHPAPYIGVVCPGDSGGPVFTMPDRNIFWVNAAGNGMTSWYGQVWDFTAQLDSTMESWSCPAKTWWDGSPVTQNERYPFARVCGSDQQNYECDPTLRAWRALGDTCGGSGCQCPAFTALGGVTVPPERSTCGSTVCGMDQAVYQCNAGVWQLVPSSQCGAETWKPAASLAQARRDHTATSLLDGRVLVVGGKNTSGALASAELYDPATGTWSPAGTLTQARYLHTATLLANGKVLIAGGYGTTARLATAQLYDPATGAWSTTGSFTTARYMHTATLLPSGKVLMAGGYAISGITSTSQLYNPATGTWSTAASLGRFKHTATSMPDGKVLIVGGGSISTLSSDAVLYDPALNAAYSAGTAPRCGYHTATLLPNGKLLVMGGMDQNSTPLATASLLQNSGAWTTAGSLIQARYSHTATLLPDGKVLVTGGKTIPATVGVTELYDPATGTSTALHSLAEARWGHTATLLSNGHVLVVGGQAPEGGYLASAELY